MSDPALVNYANGTSQVSSDNLNTFMQTCTNVSQLRNFAGNNTAISVYIRGTVVPNDGGQGTFYWNALAMGTDDNGVTTVVPNGVTIGCWTRLIVTQSIIGLLPVTFYGAKGDGSTDDTAAFAAALASGLPTYVPPPSVAYIVGDLPIPSKATLIGFSQFSYGVSPVSSSVIIRAKVGCATIFDTGGARGWFFSGIYFDGIDRTHNGIQATTGSSDSLGILQNCTIQNCNQGIGGSGTHYSQALSIQNCNINLNVTGVANIVDSRINSSVIAANTGDGISCTSGSNDNCITNSKIEFNSGNGITIFSASSITGTNNIIDRNSKAGIYFSTAAKCTFTNTVFKRNGRNDVAGQRSHWVYDGTCTDIVVNGNTTATGTDDGGGGPNTPEYIYEWATSTQSNIVVSGNDVTGYVTAESTGTAPTTALIIDGNVGGQQLVLGQAINKQNGRVFQSSKATGSVTSSGGTATLNMTQYPIGTFTNAIRELTAWVRNLSSGADYLAKFNVIQQREGSGASLSAGTVYGEVNTSGSITVAGSGTVANLAFSNVATDGSTFDIIVTNNAANNIQVDVEYK